MFQVRQFLQRPFAIQLSEAHLSAEQGSNTGMLDGEPGSEPIRIGHARAS
jgi:hypothetical protein